MNIIKTFRRGRKIVGYISANRNGTYNFCTGKPSDAGCISWNHPTIEQAESNAADYFSNAIYPL